MSEKEVSIGNAVEKIERIYSCYNPSYYLQRVVKEDANDDLKEDVKTISMIFSVDTKLHNNINELCRSLLILRKGNVHLQSLNILTLLQEEYTPLINSLKSKKTEYAKTLYFNWKLGWILNYINEASLLEDDLYAHKYNLEINEEVENKVKDMRLEYFTEEELMEIFGDEYFVEC